MARFKMPGVGPLRSGLIMVCVAGAALAITGFIVMAERPIKIRIATGARSGTYYPLGVGLAEALEHDTDDNIRASVLETGGSMQNLALLRSRRCELALVQNDTPTPRSVQMIAPIFPEVLHIVAREGIDDLSELRDARLAGGAEGSGTARLIEKVLHHYGVRVRMVHPSVSEEGALFRQGRVDAVALVSGLRAAAVDELLRVRGAHLVSLASPGAGSALEGFEINYPFASPAIIPQGTYGREPTLPIGTVSVHAILVARSDLDDDLVYDITQALYTNRMMLMRHHEVAHYLREDYDPSEIGFPLHPGADAYRRRDEPSFLERYSEMLSFLFGLSMAFGSAILGLRQLLSRVRRKGIEGYYRRVEEAVDSIEKASPDDLLRYADTLRQLQRDALRDLMADRLEANQSFTIFQDYLRTELLGIEQRIADVTRRSVP
jgi:TRAP transporter TAXI family solute receptor